MSGCDGGSCSTCSSGQDDPDRLPPGMLKRYDLNQSTADGVLVVIETVHSDNAVSLARVSAEITSEARSRCDGRLFAVVFGGQDVKPLYPEIFGYGVDTLYHVRDPRLVTYVPEAYAACIAEISERVVPAVILMGATERGREVAPRLAAALGTGLTADCTSFSMDGRRITMTRPAFGGNLMVDIECLQFPQMATIRPGSFPAPEKREGTGTAIYWQFTGDVVKEILKDVPKEIESADIRDARILISLGAGIRHRESVDVAESLARKIGAQVSCSRALVEKGWMDRSRQVGMSRRNVAPDLYIAFGISGSVQHRVGFAKAKRVIAVNNDVDAPIHGFADLSILSDAESVLTEMERSV